MSSRDPSPPRPRQLALDLPLEPALEADDFLLGEANLEAWLLLSQWPDWPHPVTRLHGPAATGKSHLTRIWSARTGARAVGPAAISEELGSLVGEGARKAFVIEDADRSGLDETGLFHLINHVAESGGSLLVTARLPIGEWGLGLPDLVSRLRAANVVRLGHPDTDLLERLLVKLFADRQIDVAPNVAAYTAVHIERAFAAAADLVARLDKASFEQRRRITLPLVAQVLAETRPGE